MVIREIEKAIDSETLSVVMDEEQSRKQFVTMVSDRDLLKTPLKNRIQTMLCKGLEKPRNFRDELFEKKGLRESMAEQKSRVLCLNVRRDPDLRYIEYHANELTEQSHLVLVYFNSFTKEYEDWFEKLRSKATLVIKAKRLLQTELRFEDGYLFYPLQINRPYGLMKRLLRRLFPCFFRSKLPHIEIKDTKEGDASMDS